MWKAIVCVVILVAIVNANDDIWTNSKGQRIVGGQQADWHKYPWLVKNVCYLPTGVGDAMAWVVCGCSSTIIHPNYLLTAGHCLNAPYPYRVGLMFSDGDIIEGFTETRHPRFQRDATYEAKETVGLGLVLKSIADLGLQRVSSPIHLSKGKQIFPIFLTSFEAFGDITGKSATLRGWGANTQNPPFTPPYPFEEHLREVGETVQNNAYCQAVLDNFAKIATKNPDVVHPFRLNDSLVCAFADSVDPYGPLPTYPALQGLCIGDSGSPLVMRTGTIFKRDAILGLVTDTFSIPQMICGYGIDMYTRLTPDYLFWISSVVFLNQGKNI